MSLRTAEKGMRRWYKRVSINKRLLTVTWAQGSQLVGSERQPSKIAVGYRRANIKVWG